MSAARGAAERMEAGGGGCGGDGRIRRWEDLNGDILASIFGRLCVADLVVGAPLVCSSWRDAAENPACWRTPDFRDWDSISRRLGLEMPDDFILLLDLFIDRSDEFLDKLHFPFFADEHDLLYVADRCPELLYFSLERSEIPQDKFCEAIKKFEFLEGMAVDESLICHEVLLHVWDSCYKFCELKVFTDTVTKEMASVICECLPNLRKLEITDCAISRQAIVTFLDNLKELEYFDISGYMNSAITCNILEKTSRLKVFLWDSKFHEGELYYCPGCNEGHFLDRPCECMVDHEAMVWLATLP